MPTVFPAHAGLTRRPASIRTSSGRVPRARGADPLEARVDAVDVLVFPAHAGLTRRRARRARHSGSVPRARGADPLFSITHCRIVLCSPRTRG